MRKVVCINARSCIEKQIKVGGVYYIDMSTAWGDSDGDWFADVYAGEYGRGYDYVGQMKLSHFRTFI